MIKKPLLFVFSTFSSLLLVAVAQPVLAATANMAVTVTGSYVPYPNPTKNTAPALYAVTVTNSGPDAATNVVVNSTAASPTKPVYFQSQAPSQGSCAGVSGSICNLGTIASGGIATIQFEVTVGGLNFDSYVVTETSVVSSDATDPNNSNNASSATVRVK